MAVGQSACLHSRPAVRDREAESSLPCASKWCVISRKVTYLYLRSEGDTCQMNRFVVRIKCDNIYVCFEKYKAFYKQKGNIIIIIIVGDGAKKEHFDQNMTSVEVSMQSPTRVHQ